MPSAPTSTSHAAVAPFSNDTRSRPPLSTSLEALQDRIEYVRARSRVDFGCLANLLPDSVPELDAMAPITPAFKCFLGGSTGLGGQPDRGVLRELPATLGEAPRETWTVEVDPDASSDAVRRRTDWLASAAASAPR